MESFTQNEMTKDDIFLNAMRKEDNKKDNYSDTGPLRKGKVVQLSSTGVFLDLSSKSEVFVPIDEFDEVPSIGDELTVMIQGVKDGLNIGSLKAAGKLVRVDELRQAYDNGLPVRGTITELITKDSVPKGFKVSLGYDIEAFLPFSQIGTRKLEDPKEIKGKSFDFAVIDYRRNNIVISRREYLRTTIRKVYGKFFEQFGEGDIIKGKVVEIEQKYLILDVDGIRAFMHISDFSWKYLIDLKPIVKKDDEIEAKIIAIDKSRDSVKVSRKELLDNPWTDIENKYSPNDVVKAKIVRFRQEGVMVELEEGVEGFLHRDEISWTKRIKNPKLFFKSGDIVEVSIKSIDADKCRIKVSLRDILDNPWESAKDNYTYGRKIKGKIASIFDFGLFVKFDDGIEGLLRKEDVDWLEKEIVLKQKFKKGDDIEVIVIAFEPSRQILKVGIKQLSDNPYKSFNLNYPKGVAVDGTVKKIMENGIIVQLENGLEGYIHISQLAKEKIEKTSDVVNKGDSITASVKQVDSSKNKIELSRKDYLYNQDRAEVERYVVNENVSNKTSTSLGSLLKEQFSGLEIGKVKLEKKTTTKTTKTKVAKKEVKKTKTDSSEKKNDKKTKTDSSEKKNDKKTKSKAKIVKKEESKTENTKDTKDDVKE